MLCSAWLATMTTSSRSEDSLVLVLSAVLNLRFTFDVAQSHLADEQIPAHSAGGKGGGLKISTQTCALRKRCVAIGGRYIRPHWEWLMSITGMRQSFACHASHIVFFMLPGVIAVENLGGHPDPCPYYGKDSPEMGWRLSLKPSLSTAEPSGQQPTPRQRIVGNQSIPSNGRKHPVKVPL